MKPLVSICCITYNHEKYISEAIESFLMQEADFPIEIIIHDDASTDRTPEIIQQYEKKYPDIIKPIYQKENQFSKGKKITFECVFPNVIGKYVALCEGDDYWNDKNKLQKQVNFMEDNEDYSMCFHAVKVVDVAGNPLGRYLGPYRKGSKSYRLKDNVQGGFVHVSSVMMRFNLIKEGMPEWAIKARHGDYALALFLSARGKTFFIDEVMSSHRLGVENSVMTKLQQNYSVDSEIEYHNQRIMTLEEADKFYNYEFTNQIDSIKKISEFKILLLKNKYTELINKKYMSFLKEKGFAWTIKFILLTKFRTIALNLAKIKGKLTVLLDKSRI